MKTELFGCHFPPQNLNAPPPRGMHETKSPILGIALRVELIQFLLVLPDSCVRCAPITGWLAGRLPHTEERKGKQKKGRNEWKYRRSGTAATPHSHASSLLSGGPPRIQPPCWTETAGPTAPPTNGAVPGSRFHRKEGRKEEGREEGKQRRA